MNIVLLKDTAKVQGDSVILKAETSDNISMFIRLNSQHTTPAITSDDV